LVQQILHRRHCQRRRHLLGRGPRLELVQLHGSIVADHRYQAA
jgi:hypothetical protein